MTLFKVPSPCLVLPTGNSEWVLGTDYYLLRMNVIRWCQVFTIYQWPSLFLVQLLDPYDFNGNMDLIEETDGVRCGPQNICKNQTCVGVASYPSTCLQCPGQFGGCDQHHQCYCDVKYHGNVSCNNGTYKPIEPGIAYYHTIFWPHTCHIINRHVNQFSNHCLNQVQMDQQVYLCPDINMFEIMLCMKLNIK